MTALTHHARAHELIHAAATWASPHLIITEAHADGSRNTRLVQLGACDESWVIGRGEEADIHLDDPHISRRHAIITIQQGRVSIEDLHARWGITKSGQKVLNRCTLEHGEQVVMGSTTITLNHYWEQLQRQRSTPVSIAPESPSRGSSPQSETSTSPVSVGPSILGWTLPKYSRPLEAPPPPLAPPAQWEENVKLAALLVLAIGGIYLIISLFFPGGGA